MSTAEKQHILIAGAGLGGLTLAQCLRAHNHPFTIFDRDTSASSRSQGWAIALHTVLPELVASMPEDMPSIEVVNHLLPLKNLKAQLSYYDVRRPDEAPVKFMVESETAADSGYGPGRIIRANRDRLRHWLASDLDIQWGKRVTNYHQDHEGVTVEFADGSTTRGDVLVGADGAGSCIRAKLMPEAQLERAPQCMLTGEVKMHKKDYEKQLHISHSCYVTMAEDCFMFVGLKCIAPDASSAEYYWDLGWSDPARVGTHWIDTAPPEDLYNFVREKTAKIDPRLTEIIRLTQPQQIMTPPLVLRDILLGSMPVSRVTLIGDAAHVMMPFQGEGGCHAMQDAMNLAKTLVAGGDLAVFQEEMLARSSKAVKASRAAGKHGDETQTETRTAWGRPVTYIGPWTG